MVKKDTKIAIQEMYSLLFRLGRSMREKRIGLSKTPVWTLPLAHAETMIFIAENGAVSMKQLSDYLDIQPPSTTALVNQLVKAKLVTRERIDKDRRTVFVKISKLGAEVLQERTQKAHEIMEETFSMLNRQEQNQLMKILTKIVTNFKK